MEPQAVPASGGENPSFDVIVVGAGLSGVGAAYRLQTLRPHASFAVLEARHSLGGTWDLFRYPGVRSDSDMHTLGYPFKPWRGGKPLADGASILEYIRHTAEAAHLNQRIQYGSKVVEANFETAAALWHLTVLDTVTGQRRLITCRFLYSCAGYFDYEKPHAPEFVDHDTFEGVTAHPQFWPHDLDYAAKRVVVIGSGATAVTLVPALLEGPRAAAHVTLLQRSPTWISAVPTRDKIADFVTPKVPHKMAHALIRGKNIAFSTAFYQFCRRFPGAARTLLTRSASRVLGEPKLVATHFTPTYNPWEQRLCAAPGGDVFKAIQRGDADVVTAHIDRFTREGIVLKTGALLPADIIITATGLRLQAFGGIELCVDGTAINLSQQYVWNGAMVTGLPNFAMCVGYTNASWTLRADLTHRLVCKVLAWMDRKNYTAVEPRPAAHLTPAPLLNLASGYVKRSIDVFPKQGNRGPWRMRQNYVIDAMTTLNTPLGRTLKPVQSRELRATTSTTASNSTAAPQA